MKANELRIGNFIQTNDGKQITVTGQVIYEGVEGYFQGIPLTEEWLLKFGLQKHNWIEHSGRNYFHNERDFGVEKTKDGFIFDGWGINTVKYVHQLQNLYFALTGEELTIKS